MIEFEQALQNYIDFLNERYPAKETLQIIPLYGCQTATLSGDSNNAGFAVYIYASRAILLPMEPVSQDDEPNWLLRNLAHEYKHFLNHINGTNYLFEEEEQDAERFADKVVDEYELQFGEAKPTFIISNTLADVQGD